jgi:hypothetical protein
VSIDDVSANPNSEWSVNIVLRFNRRACKIVSWASVENALNGDE